MLVAALRLMALGLVLLVFLPASCLAAGKAVHGFFVASLPFSRLDAQGQPEGLCPEIAEGLAGGLIHHVPLRREAAGMLLRAGIVDFYFAFVGEEEAPPQGLAFGPAVLESGLVIVARDEEKGLDCIRSFRPVGVLAGGWEEQALAGLRSRTGGHCRVRLYPSRAALALALAKGDVASVLAPECTASALQDACRGLDLDVSAPVRDCGAGVLVPVFREDDASARRLFAAELERFRQSGALARVLLRWGLESFGAAGNRN